MPEKITARFNIVTPMFIGDANQEATSISPPAVKGALRFWWRALNWGVIRNASQSDSQALQQLHQRESELFGSAAEQGTGQASFKISVSPSKFKSHNKGQAHSSFKTNDASRYLGYGLMGAFGKNAGVLDRGCLDEAQEFVVTLRSRKNLSPSVLEALKLFGLLGSLGSRARHGLGSVALQDLKRGDNVIWAAPQSRDSYIEEVRSYLNDVSRSLPPFSALSNKSRIDILLSGKTPYQTLGGFAQGQMLYRSWGRTISGTDGPKVLGQPSEMRFKADHDWKDGPRPNGFHPKRIIFGLPHNYGKGNRFAVNGEHYDRRSSPLIFHVHKIGSEYIGVSTLLTSTFLPKSERINAGGAKVPAKVEWDILHEFLDGKDKQGNARFANRERVL